MTMSRLYRYNSKSTGLLFRNFGSVSAFYQTSNPAKAEILVAAMIVRGIKASIGGTLKIVGSPTGTMTSVFVDIAPMANTKDEFNEAVAAFKITWATVIRPCYFEIVS